MSPSQPSRQPRRTAGTATSAAAPTSGSQTILQTASQPNATLRLRAPSAEPGEGSSSARRIQWAEDVVDNEHMGKKSSKVCCIYHEPHEPGESGSESSDSSSGSESDSEPDLSRARKAGGSGKGRRGRGKGEHDHGEDGGSGKGKERKPSPNAYERQPKHKAKKEG